MPTVLILTTSHGASHRRASEALKKAFLQIHPRPVVEIVEAIEHCARWFRAYYDSYLIPLRFWPGLWRRIERRQHQGSSTNPSWLYRLGGRPLFRRIQALAPDVVIATEVGVCELAVLHKRRGGARYFLVGLELMDFNRAWVQPEVDFYPVVHADLGEELIQAGAPRSKVLDCGMPIDPIFTNPPGRAEARARLGLKNDAPVLLVLFGGTGFGNPGQIVASLRKIQPRFQAVFIAGKNRALEADLRRLTGSGPPKPGWPEWKVLGWAGNIHEWMVAADLLLSKPGGGTVMEASACGLPLVVFDPLPGNEERTCGWLEKWRVGVWVRSASEIAPVISNLLTHPEARAALRERAGSLARPHAAFQTAEAILKRLPSHPPA